MIAIITALAAVAGLCSGVYRVTAQKCQVPPSTTPKPTPFDATPDWVRQLDG